VKEDKELKFLIYYEKETKFFRGKAYDNRLIKNPPF